MTRHPNTTPQGAVVAFDAHPAQQAKRNRPAPTVLTAIVPVWDDTRQGFRSTVVEVAA